MSATQWFHGLLDKGRVGPAEGRWLHSSDQDRLEKFFQGGDAAPSGSVLCALSASQQLKPGVPIHTHERVQLESKEAHLLGLNILVANQLLHLDITTLASLLRALYVITLKHC